MSDVAEPIVNFLERFQNAWDSADARAFASLFADDATYVTWLGEPLFGRERIKNFHKEVFASSVPPGMKMDVKAISVKHIGPDFCCMVTSGGLGMNDPVAHDKVQTLVLTRSDGEWRCVAFQNTLISEQAKNGRANDAPEANGADSNWPEE